MVLGAGRSGVAVGIVVGAVGFCPVAVGFIDDIAHGVGEVNLVDGKAFRGDHLAVAHFHTAAHQIYPGFCFLCLLLGFRFCGNQVHVLSGDGQGVNLSGILQFRIQTGQHRSLCIHNGIAVGAEVPGKGVPAGRTGDFCRASTQNRVGVMGTDGVGGFRSQILYPLGDDIVHGLVVQIILYQNQGTGSTAYNAHQGSGAQEDGQNFHKDAVFHFVPPSIL